MTIHKRLEKGQALTAAEYDETITDLDERPNGQVYPKTKNVGLKVDNAAPVFPWFDLIGDAQTDMDGAPGIPWSAPTATVFIGGIAQPLFDVDDARSYLFHIPHDWVQDHDAFIHVHWSHNSDTVTAGEIGVQFEVTAAKGHDQQAFPIPKIYTGTQVASTARYQHMILEVPFCEIAGGIGGLLLPSEDMEVDTLILCNVKLISNTMDGGAKPFIHTCDLHYRSTGMGTVEKSPAPTFWG